MKNFRWRQVDGGWEWAEIEIPTARENLYVPPPPPLYPATEIDPEHPGVPTKVARAARKALTAPWDADLRWAVSAEGVKTFGLRACQEGVQVVMTWAFKPAGWTTPTQPQPARWMKATKTREARWVEATPGREPRWRDEEWANDFAAIREAGQELELTLEDGSTIRTITNLRLVTHTEAERRLADG